MGLTWEEIQTIVTGMKPDAVGSVVLSDNASVSELAWYAWLVNMKIARSAHKFRALKREYSLSLTGATEYNLGSLVPDLQQVIQVLDGQVEIGYRQYTEFNINSGGIIQTIIGKTLRLKEARSGTLVIPYVSNYLVLDDDLSTRKRHFIDAGDQTVLYDDMIPAFIEGLMDFIYRKANGGKEYLKTVQMPDGSITQMNAFEYELQQIILNDAPMERVFFDFRYLQ